MMADLLLLDSDQFQRFAVQATQVSIYDFYHGVPLDEYITQDMTLRRKINISQMPI